MKSSPLRGKKAVAAKLATDGRGKGDGRVLKAKHGPTSDRVLEWMECYVRDNRVQIGDPLPAEDEIVEATGISRTCVREAITRLRSFGVIESRRKRGMRLTRSIQLLDFVKMLANDHPSYEDLGHLGSFRSALELGLIPEIFKNCGPREIREMEKAYKAMEEDPEDDILWGKADMAFHEVMIRATGNKLATWYLQMLQPFFSVIVTTSSDTREQSLAKHYRIIEGLKTRDAFGFEQAMRDHHLVKLDPKAEFYREAKISFRD
jgi:DNA-binding FadR family transcriptional regulator